ncbi:MAG: thiL [Gammaproteobacteria bacterium]|nr:thiL [Gammaproteobacteria bacterium]
MAIHEFDLIERYFKRPSTAPGIAKGIGDDCAILEIPEGHQLAVSIDTLVSGVHFPEHTKAYDIGYKALAVNLSDCAAMGAKPLWATLAISLPKADEAWLKAFAEGFFVMANSCGVALIGGDTTRGPLSISVQIHGIIPKGKALLRASAKSGDDIYATGTLGDAGLALQTLLGHLPKLDSTQQSYIESRLNRPSPRVEIGQALQNIAHACIDISDGLAADLNHILKASRVGAEIELDKLPLSAALKNLDPQKAIELALHSGDDYELCFTATPGMEDKIQALSHYTQTPITKIGKIVQEPGLFSLDANNKVMIKPSGYIHFQ